MKALIERKKRGGEMQPAELDALCRGVVRGEVPEGQLAAWLMAVCWRGMTEAETLALTRALVATGRTLRWDDSPRPVVDKHSTGGVGDKTSLVLVPLMAAAGLAFAKMSGRGLGHTGGTLDKLEAIPGFRVVLDPKEMQAQVRRIGCALVGQSAELVPADGILYALRDVTGTVDSIPLIASSVMSKKLAGGASTLVLDVKHGAGAFMQTAAEARELARALVAIGEGAGRRTRAVLSPMDQPLGDTVGNALEVREAIETLHGGGPAELWALTEELGVHLLLLTAAGSEAEARHRLRELRSSGAAAAHFAELVAAQGGDPRVVEDTALLPRAPHLEPLIHAEGGERWVRALDARGVGEAALALGAGRRTRGEAVDPAVGIRLRARIGDRVGAGDTLAEIHARTPAGAAEAAALIRAAYRLSPEPVPPPEPVYEVV